MRDTCREMLHRYCLQSIREDQNVVELCGEYKKSFHESIENVSAFVMTQYYFYF